MRFGLLSVLCTWLCIAALLFSNVDAAVDHIEVPRCIPAGKPFQVTFHTRKNNLRSKQWIAIVGVTLGEPRDSSLGVIVGSIPLVQAKLSQTGDGAFSQNFIAPNWPAMGGQKVTVTAQYLETYGQTNRGDIRSQSIATTLCP